MAEHDGDAIGGGDSDAKKLKQYFPKTPTTFDPK